MSRHQPTDTGDARGATVDALQAALGVEHAAVWCYGLAAAFVDDADTDALALGAAAHGDRREGTEQALRELGAQPVLAEPAYRTPEPVADAEGARALLSTAEDDCVAAWRYGVQRGSGPVRTAALDAMLDAAVRGARWRAANGTSPVTVTFPGAP